MKKTVTLVILGVLAVALIIIGVVSVAGKSKPTPEGDGTTASAVSTEEEIISISDIFGKDETTMSAAVTEAVTEKETKKSIFDIFSKDETTTSPQTEPSTAKPAVIVDDYAYAYAGFRPAYADMDKSDWNLILVNRDYILPDGYKPELAPCITDDPDSLKLDYRVAPHYNKMYQAALEDGIELTPVSGYRSVERQTRNFENKIQKYVDEGYSKTEATQMAATIILPPGTSEHNAGLAMDICSLYESFENSEEFEWLSENAADYGFILRYPEDKQDITKIIYEPWHWRYVGVEAAKEMKASGQCLEEYLGVA